MALIPAGNGLVATTLTDWLNGQDAERLTRYREHLDFYEGQQWERRKRPGETRLTLNYARALVRKVASYVYPEPVSFTVQPNEAAGISEELAARAERAINGLAAELDLHGLDFQTLMDASVLGDGAFKVTWDQARGRPLVAAVDPSGLWAWTAADNVRDVQRVVQRYHLLADEAQELFSSTANIGVARTVAVVEDWTPARMKIEVGGTTVRDEANPYGWIPYIVFPNIAKPHSLWGESDLVDLLDVCRELNRRMTVLSRILQVSGNPIVVLENVAGSSGIRADEGAVWELPEDSKAYLLDMLAGGGVRLHVEYVEQLYRALFDLAEVPRTAFGDSQRTLSGVALEVEIQPLVQKVQRKRRIWDSVYRRRNAMLLDLLERFGGLDLGGARQTNVVWGSILPNDRETLVRAESALVASQIHSRRMAMDALGVLDVEREWRRILEEDAALTPGPSPAASGRGEKER
jgi:hypothetical protein